MNEQATKGNHKTVYMYVKSMDDAAAASSRVMHSAPDGIAFCVAAAGGGGGGIAVVLLALVVDGAVAGDGVVH